MGKSLTTPMQATPRLSTKSMPTDWLKYANQNATRNDPLSGQLIESLDFLPELGVELEVFSGGQENNTTHGTGSNRHTGGHAADAFLMRNGRRLNPNNPDDLPIFQAVAMRAKERGLSMGAGDNYMQPGSIHIGFGQFGRKEPPIIWGKSGKGEYAAQWLKDAWNLSKPNQAIANDAMAAIGKPSLDTPQAIAADTMAALGKTDKPDGLMATIDELLNGSEREMSPLEALALMEASQPVAQPAPRQRRERLPEPSHASADQYIKSLMAMLQS